MLVDLGKNFNDCIDRDGGAGRSEGGAIRSGSTDRGGAAAIVSPLRFPRRSPRLRPGWVPPRGVRRACPNADVREEPARILGRRVAPDPPGSAERVRPPGVAGRTAPDGPGIGRGSRFGSPYRADNRGSAGRATTKCVPVLGLLGPGPRSPGQLTARPLLWIDNE